MLHTRIRCVFKTCVLFLLSCTAKAQNGPVSFRIRHQSSERYFVSRNFINTKDNGTVIVGKWGTTEDGADLLIMKLDDRGEVEWSKRVATGIRLDKYLLCESVDGSIVFAGNSQYNGPPVNSDILLMKFDCKGEVVWSKNVSMTSPVSKRFLTPYSIIAGNDNDVILSYYSGELNWQYAVIARIDANGNMVWSKTFYGTDAETNRPTVCFVKGNKIVVLGFNSLYRNTFNYYKSFFAMVLDYASGNTEEIKGYDYAEYLTGYGVLVTDMTIHFYAEQLDNGGFAIFGEFSNYSPTTCYYYRLTLGPDLRVTGSNTFAVPMEMGGQYSKLTVLPNGQSHLLSLAADYRRLVWYTADEGLSKIREKSIYYNGSYVDFWYKPRQKADHAMNFIVSDMTLPAGTLEITQLQDNDISIDACIGNDTAAVSIQSWSVSDGAMSWRSVSNNEVLITPLTFVSVDVPVSSQYMCAPPVGSAPESELKITGPSAVCSSKTAEVFIGHSVNTQISWQIASDSSDQLVQMNDSVVSVNFLPTTVNPRTVKLYATSGSCKVLADSMTITVYPGRAPVVSGYSSCDLPLDLAPQGLFQKYTWQDLSTLPTFRATAAGRYYVYLENYCGEIITDSFTVRQEDCGNPPGNPSRAFISMPNAFSPNNDGKNDILRPAVRGALVFYQLRVFNRWGQVVFKSSDVSAGWDGSFNGHPQKSDLFVWKMEYAFEGQSRQIATGTVTVVR